MRIVERLRAPAFWLCESAEGHPGDATALINDAAALLEEAEAALEDAGYAIHRMLAAQHDIETREDLKGDLQMQMRSAKQDCEDAAFFARALLAKLHEGESDEAAFCHNPETGQ